MVDRNDHDRVGAAGTRKSWIPWAIGAALLLLLLIFGLRGCDDATDRAAVDPATTDLGAATTGTTTGTAGGTTVAANGSYSEAGLRTYLQGTDAAGANGQSFGLDQVTFDTGSSTLDAQDQAVIAQVAGVLKQFPNATAQVTGYADPAGDAAANQKLAAQRAVAVKQALASAGIAADKLTAVAEGETGDAAVQQNRRVELMVRR